MGHPANCLRNKELNSICIYYSTMPRLEIYRNDSLKSIVNGPEFFEPKYEFKETVKGTVAFSEPETRFAYMDAQADRRYIYLFYSGKNNYQTCGKWLLVFDWLGNPVAKFNLEANYCHFSIINAGGHNKIYTVNQDTGELVAAVLNI